MSTKRSPQAPSSTGLILTFLALVALIGLMLGILTHALVSRSGRVAQTPAIVSVRANHTPTATATSAATSTSPSSAFTGHFELTLSVSPKSVKAGQQITVTVHAYTADTHAAISGLQCLLRAPIDGSPSLLTSYPAAQTTDNTGAASWIITAPSQAAGTYEIETFAQTQSWGSRADSTVNLTGA
ncbi:MAG TPA: hypothetical protein VF792_09095 [Ktedonobacterales bacterium]